MAILSKGIQGHQSSEEIMLHLWPPIPSFQIDASSNPLPPRAIVIALLRSFTQKHVPERKELHNEHNRGLTFLCAILPAGLCLSVRGIDYIWN